MDEVESVIERGRDLLKDVKLFIESGVEPTRENVTPLADRARGLIESKAWGEALRREGQMLVTVLAKLEPLLRAVGVAPRRS